MKHRKQSRVRRSDKVESYLSWGMRRLIEIGSIVLLLFHIIDIVMVEINNLMRNKML